MAKRTSSKEMVLVCFVFNGPMLVPWVVVDGVEDRREAVLLWNEAHRRGYRFKENEEVCEVNNPYQKMVIRRILRRAVGEKEDRRNQIVGFECYWWHDVGLPLYPGMNGARRVPGAMGVE